MSQMRIGVVHPGNMGASVAASFLAAGNAVFWASEGRSPATRTRAQDAGLEDVVSLRNLCATCSLLVAVCPPHAASEVADEVIGHGFTGTYIDANAISPQTSVSIGERIVCAGASFVDGGIIGGPAWTPGNTCLYLSGKNARELAAFLCGGALEVSSIGNTPGKASALKMCYAAYTKGSSALLAAILATATHYEVRENLETQWGRDDSGFPQQTRDRTRRVTAKAWRFIGEMQEIASTFQAAGVPGGFHLAAAEVYRRMDGLEQRAELPQLEEILSRLLRP